MAQGLGEVPEIKIKKSNVGKFTSYCKRKGYDGVTAKCIAEGKKSKDAGVRKMAIFAENSRKWKN